MENKVWTRVPFWPLSPVSMPCQCTLSVVPISSPCFWYRTSLHFSLRSMTPGMERSQVFMAKKSHFRWNNEILMDLSCPSSKQWAVNAGALWASASVMPSSDSDDQHDSLIILPRYDAVKLDSWPLVTNNTTQHLSLTTAATTRAWEPGAAARVDKKSVEILEFLSQTSPGQVSWCNKKESVIWREPEQSTEITVLRRNDLQGPDFLVLSWSNGFIGRRPDKRIRLYNKQHLSDLLHFLAAEVFCLSNVLNSIACVTIFTPCYLVTSSGIVMLSRLSCRSLFGNERQLSSVRGPCCRLTPVPRESLLCSG